jgi:hypothetical protein
MHLRLSIRPEDGLEHGTICFAQSILVIDRCLAQLDGLRPAVIMAIFALTVERQVKAFSFTRRTMRARDSPDT